jgi:hypothetical protein
MLVPNIKIPIKLSPSRAVTKVCAIAPCVVATCRRARLSTPESIETLVCVSDEGEAGRVLVLSGLRGLCPVRSAVVVLVDLVNREVLRIDVGLQLGLERRTDAAKAIPGYATEERMLLDLTGTTNASKTVIGIADQTVASSVSNQSTDIMTMQGILTASRNPRLRHPIAGPEGSAGCGASRQSCGMCRGALRRRMVASR